MTLADFWEATPWQVCEVVKAAREREVSKNRRALIQAHHTASFATRAFVGKLPKLDEMLRTFDDAVSEHALPVHPQTPEEQAALLRAFVSKQVN